GGQGVTAGQGNVAIGVADMQNGNGGNFNVAIGKTTLISNASTGSRNVAIGHQNETALTVGADNVFIGALIDGVTSGTGNTIIGANQAALATNLTNNILISDGTGAVKIKHDATDIFLKNSAAFATRYMTTLTNNAAANTATLTNA